MDPALVTVVLTTVAYVADLVIKVIAVGLVPENRRPSSSQAWLLLILLLPGIGLPLFLLIGSPYVRGRRQRLQRDVNAAVLERGRSLPALPARLTPDEDLSSVAELNRSLTGLPLTTGTSLGLHHDYDESIRAMARLVDTAERSVDVEMYILAWDDTTEVFFDALARAVQRGVRVRLLMDHLGSRGYPGWRRLGRRLTAIGVDWHLMMPLRPWRGEWRRPDLRNHRKLVTVDQTRGIMGSQNMIDASYLKKKNRRIGRLWNDCNIELSGPVVRHLDVVFATDWYAETAKRAERRRRRHGEATRDLNAIDPADRDLFDPPGEHPADGVTAMQVVPSGPGFVTEPNLRLFTALVHEARHRLAIVSPYFVPDEALLLAITSAAMRGVEVELFVSEQADQFMVHHAQRSYYEQLLVAGVRIWALPRPAVLHAKYMTVDDAVGVFGSSNMDMRSFYLDYEITLMGMGPEFVADLDRVSQHYRDLSFEIELDSWRRRPIVARYLDNVMRLTSALQ